MGSRTKAPETKEILSAIVLADSFTQRFRPMTVERPKVLLPLVNVPMIDYTLEWLVASGVDEILVFCCAHANQVKKHLEDAKWLRNRACRISAVVSTNCSSAGEALRLIDQKHLIKNDFILVTGDTVSNMDMRKAVELHRQRREKDKLAIMTMIMRPAASPLHRARLGKDELAVVVSPATGQLLKYEDLGLKASGGRRTSRLAVDAHLFGEHDVLSARTDLLDCQIYIAAPEVLMLFSDNFDYQNVRREFVTGVLSEEELGNKIFVHELGRGEYAERVPNLRAYDAVSRDILGRWAFPFVPDTNVLPAPPPAPWASGSTYHYARGNVYREHNVAVARGAVIGHDTCIGAHSSIQEDALIETSVLGRDCEIGRNVVLRDSYIGDSVTIHDGATVVGALVLEGAVIQSGAKLLPGCIVSFKCVVGAGHTVTDRQRISLCQQTEPTSQFSSDDDLEEPSTTGFSSRDDDDAAADPSEQPSSHDVRCADALAFGRHIEGGSVFQVAVVGNGGAGYEWKPPDDDVRFSIAATDYSAPVADDSSSEAASTGTMADLEVAEEAAADDADTAFQREVSETFLRCKREGFQQTNAIIELNALKIAEDKTFADCARYIFTTILALCLPVSPRVRAEYRDLFPTAPPDTGGKEGRSALLRAFQAQLAEWSGILQRFLKSEDDQVEIILTFEEFCSEDGEFAAEHGAAFATIFTQVLKQLYDSDILAEDALLAWADEKEHASKEERVFLDKARPLIDWLRTADSSGDESDTE